MEELFLHHKPRFHDIIKWVPTKPIKRLIRVLYKVSRSSKNVIRYSTELFMRHPFLLVYIILSGVFFHKNLTISYEDSVYLSNIKQITRCPKVYGKPKVVGIIPDGNRRWSRILGRESYFGHFMGSCRIADLIRWSIVSPCVSHLVVYLLSYDNYQKRSVKEQNGIREILQKWIRDFGLIHKRGYADIAVIGEPSRVFRETLGELPVNPKDRNTSVTKISLLMCYDGKREIRHSGGDEERLWIRDDIYLVIRTGFTQRSSGFCPMQTTYSEWVYPGMFWPEFSIDTFENILSESYKITQNYGR